MDGREHFVPDPALFQLKPWRAMTALMADWGLIAAALASAIRWPHPVTYILAAIIVARTQLALAVIMHESAHGTLLPHQRYNDAVGQACAAGPLLLSMKMYRAGHLRHHQFPMQEDDPVARVFGINDYPISRAQLALRLLADLSGFGYCQSALKMLCGDYQSIMPKVPKSISYVIWEVFSILASNGLLLGLLAWSGHAWLYMTLWILPAVTLLPLFGRIRAIMEHAGLPASHDQSQNARTIVRPSWQTFLCGPHGIHYHIEHHLHVRMPFYHLRKLHDQMAANSVLPSRNLYRGYDQVLRDVSTPQSE